MNVCTWTRYHRGREDQPGQGNSVNKHMTSSSFNDRADHHFPPLPMVDLNLSCKYSSNAWVVAKRSEPWEYLFCFFCFGFEQ